LIGVGLKFTTVDRVGGTDRASIKIVRHGPVELAASQAAAANANAGAVARVIRAAAEQVADRARLEDLRPLSGLTLGGGAAGSVIMLGADGRSRATAGEVRAATDMLAATWLAARKQNQPCTAVESMMIGAAVLGAVLDQLAVAEIVIDGEGAGARTNPAG
jgi:hypothetical protein